MSIHRRALIPVNGRAWISQRFAIDWVRPFSDGKTCHGAQNTDCRAYGEPAIAVADGVVSEIKDGIPQNVPGDTRAVWECPFVRSRRRELLECLLRLVPRELNGGTTHRNLHGMEQRVGRALLQQGF